MKVDNLFVVESPLQALVALELNLQFSDEKNGIIYRLSGAGRERNDNQIKKIVDRGNWMFAHNLSFNTSGALACHLSIRKSILSLRREYSGRVKRVFFGEFRAQWMHFLRLAIRPDESVLIDDGAYTLTAKKKYIDCHNYYPEEIWRSDNKLKNLIKNTLYIGVFNKELASKPIAYASAFLKEESDYQVDFSALKKRLFTHGSCRDEEKKVYFFGSKYSEAGIVSQKYELIFISQVKDFYQRKGLDFVYCAHRDESQDKLDYIESIIGVDVVMHDEPAEVFMMEHSYSGAEIGAAYSSVLNNLNLIFPEVAIVSFKLKSSEVNKKNKYDIEHIYRYFEDKGITVVSF